MQPTKRAIAAEIQRLEFAQFQDPDDRERLNSIRALAQEQLDEDRPGMSGNQRDRIGRAVTGRVLHADPDLGAHLWRRWTPSQMAMEDNMAPLLRELSRMQAEVVHLLYWGRLSYRQVAAVLGIKAGAVQVHERRAVAKLRAAITERFLTQPGAPTRDGENAGSRALPFVAVP